LGCWGKNIPPEPKAEPEVDANAAAWDWIPGSEAAWSFRTDWRRKRKWGFSVRESGVGGILEVVPIERLGEGGEVGRRERMEDVDGDVGLGWTYCVNVNIYV
jgi:hypothetical protein